MHKRVSKDMLSNIQTDISVCILLSNISKCPLSRKGVSVSAERHEFAPWLSESQQIVHSIGQTSLGIHYSIHSEKQSLQDSCGHLLTQSIQNHLLLLRFESSTVAGHTCVFSAKKVLNQQPCQMLHSAHHKSHRRATLPCDKDVARRSYLHGMAQRFITRQSFQVQSFLYSCASFRHLPYL